MIARARLVRPHDLQWMQESVAQLRRCGTALCPGRWASDMDHEESNAVLHPVLGNHNSIRQGSKSGDASKILIRSQYAHIIKRMG